MKLSAIHELEFVYPETVYNYNCIYYSDNVFDGDDTKPTNELGRASFSCSIGDWNPDWDVFIASSWQVDENGNDINPDLYRDTELALTWDYFGFDKNLFRPEGMPEGIYLWNPRSWQPNGDIHFTFRELIRAGTQYVVYPCVQPDLYKIWVLANTVNTYRRYISSGLYERSYYANPGIRGVDLSVPSATQFRDCIKDSEAERVVDINFEGEMINDNSNGEGYTSPDAGGRVYTQLGSNFINTGFNFKVHNVKPMKDWVVLAPPGFDSTLSKNSKYFQEIRDNYGSGENYSVMLNL